MGKKDYIEAMNEIEPRDTLKKETFSKMTENKKMGKGLYPLLSMAAMLILVVAIGIPLSTLEIKKKNVENNHKINIGKEESETTETIKLAKVENFENLYAMLEKIEDNQRKFYQDSIVNVTGPSLGNMDSANAEMKEEVTVDNEREKVDYSTTNTQEENVDEADIVKTDGKYIYYLTGQKLSIIGVQNNELKQVSSIDFKDEKFKPIEIFVQGDRLIIIGSKSEKMDIMPLRSEETTNSRAKYSYPSTTYTIVKVYHLENREKPELVRTVEVEGSYISSRMIDSYIYLMSNKYIYFYNEHKITELNPEAFKPRFLDTAVSNEMKGIDFSNIYCLPDRQKASYLNVLSFDVTKNEEANIDSYLGAGEEIYSSDKNIYVTSVKYNNEENSGENIVTTGIYKFNLEEGRCKFNQQGEVPGSVLNQFSMSEDGEYFRIATTDSKSWSNKDNTNNLYVLDSNLEVVGKVEGLAKGERIYSVRFMGDRAYMVTFVQTDPLFVIDLSNPENPTVLGELKIPGYSKYLHPYDNTHIIGFGENTELVNYGYGDRVITNGMKMALFDVTDPNNPQELYSVNLGEKGTSSELLYNHKALLFSKEKDIIAFPITKTEDNYKVNFIGAIVYGLNLEKGFTLKGEISHNENSYDLYEAGNEIQRIIYVGETLFTLSENGIKATDMNTMKELNHIQF